MKYKRATLSLSLENSRLFITVDKKELLENIHATIEAGIMKIYRKQEVVNQNNTKNENFSHNKKSDNAIDS